MKRLQSLPLKGFAWASFLGISCFIALSYLGFLSTSTREGELLRTLVVQDSLLIDSFHILIQAGDPGESATLRRDEFLRTLSAHDSALSALPIGLPPPVTGALQRYRTGAMRSFDGDTAHHHGDAYWQFIQAQYELRNHVGHLIDEADLDLRSQINLWAGVSLIIVLSGFWLAIAFARLSFRRSRERDRLESILEVSEDPVIVYGIGGEVLFLNEAFRTAFLRVKNGEPRVERFGYLSTVPTEEDSRTSLWETMSAALQEGPSWTRDVACVMNGEHRYYHMYAFSVREETREASEIVVLHSDATEKRRLQRRAVEAEHQYRSMVEDSPDALVLLQNRTVVYANHVALRLFGFSDSVDVSSVRFAELFGPAGNPAFHVSVEGKNPGEQLLRNAEFRATTRDGRLVDVEVSASVVRWKDELALQATIRDITERKLLEREQALWAWEQDALSDIDKKLVGIADLERILKAIITQVLALSQAHIAGVLMLEESGGYVRWRAMVGNERAGSEEERFEVTPSILAMLSGEDALVVQELKDDKRIVAGSIPGLRDEGILSSVWLPLRVEERRQGVLAVAYRSYHAFGEREMRLLSSMAEKTSIAIANAALYENLLRREQELEILSGARIDAQEEERRRIAREIHDGLGQILTAIKLNIEIMEDSPGLAVDDREKILSVKGLLDSVMQEAREISYNLMPSVLEDFGLSPALQLLSERFGKQSGVGVSYFSKMEIGRLNQRMEVALYRIVQEALTNAVRHGRASQVTVQLGRQGDALRLTVEDNGKGMDEAMPRIRRAEGGGIGLASMRERVNSFNGTLVIDSAPGKGTLVIVEMPVTKGTEKESL